MVPGSRSRRQAWTHMVSMPPQGCPVSTSSIHISSNTRFTPCPAVSTLTHSRIGAPLRSTSSGRRSVRRQSVASLGPLSLIELRRDSTPAGLASVFALGGGLLLGSAPFAAAFSPAFFFAGFFLDCSIAALPDESTLAASASTPAAASASISMGSPRAAHASRPSSFVSGRTQMSLARRRHGGSPPCSASRSAAAPPPPSGLPDTSSERSPLIMCASATPPSALSRLWCSRRSVRAQVGFSASPSLSALAAAAPRAPATAATPSSPSPFHPRLRPRSDAWPRSASAIARPPSARIWFHSSDSSASRRLACSAAERYSAPSVSISLSSSMRLSREVFSPSASAMALTPRSPIAFAVRSSRSSGCAGEARSSSATASAPSTPAALRPSMSTRSAGAPLLASACSTEMMPSEPRPLSERSSRLMHVFVARLFASGAAPRARRP
mmetsp:Transcript_45959/g.121187  ORF Transcript_45959/g.121187 Transcript_45959/m.121187 type:complete len:440 (+) Transcript_45959:114-1433(+)